MRLFVILVKLSSPEARADATQLTRALWLLLIAFVVACVLRMGSREVKPMHVDESTQAVKLHELLEGNYSYDPKDHHGPTLLYATVPVMAMTGTKWTEMSESRLRLVPALFGVTLLLLLVLVADGLASTALAWAAVFMAVSPLMVFYSRYYIMEMLLVWFTFACIACGWRYYMSRRVGWLIWSGIFAGLMHGTKETCILQFAAMGAGLIAVNVAEYFTAGSGLGVVNRNKRSPFGKQAALIFIASATVSSIVVFSQFFTDWRGVPDSIMTYFKMLDRAGGQGHEKPFWYYFRFLWGGSMAGSPASLSDVGFFSWQRWSNLLGITTSPLLLLTEAAILFLAAIGGAHAFLSHPTRNKSNQLVRFLAVYGVVTFFIYSIISYKTPWCIMGAWHAFLIMAGLGVHVILNVIWNRWAQRLVSGIFILIAANLALQSWRITRDYAAYARNPYNYSMTAADCLEWVARIRKFAELQPEGVNMRIDQNDLNGGWPLPWYLGREFPNYNWKGGTMDLAKSSVVILSGAAETQLLQELAEAGQTRSIDEGFFRQVITLYSSGALVIYVKKDLWDRYVAGQPWPTVPVQM